MSTAIELALLPNGRTDLEFQLATRAAPYTLLVTEYLATETAIAGVYTITVNVADGDYRIKSVAGQWPESLGAVKIAGTSGKVYGSFEELDVATDIGNIPKYGDVQTWDNGTDTIEVTVTEA